LIKRYVQPDIIKDAANDIQACIMDNFFGQEIMRSNVTNAIVEHQFTKLISNEYR